MKEIPSSYRVRIWYGKTRIAGLQFREGRTMIDSVVWAQYINVSDTQTDRQTILQPRRHSNSRPNALSVRPPVPTFLGGLFLLMCTLLTARAP